MSENAPYSEFSKYPEITEAQKNVLQSIGVALFGIHGVEDKLKFLLSFVFPAKEDSTLQELYSLDQKKTKEALGQLIHKLNEQATVTPEFKGQLTKFLLLRNRFIHGLLCEKDYNFGSDEGIEHIHSFLADLEFYAWHIDAVLMVYIIIFAKALRIHDKIVNPDHIYFQNLHKYFSPKLNFKEKS